MIILLMFTTCNNVMVPTPPLDVPIELPPVIITPEPELPIPGEPNVAVTGISLQKSVVLIRALHNKDNYRLYANVVPHNAFNRNVTWYSNRPNFIEVDQNGRIEYGVSTGTAVITARTVDGNFEAECIVSIISSYSNIQPIKITLNVTEITISMGSQPYPLIATIIPEEVTNQNINWSSDNGSVGVNSNGVVTPYSPNTTAIIKAESAENANIYATCIIRVN